MKKILLVMGVAAVIGAICGYAANYFMYLGVEENFMYWKPEK